MQLNKNEQIPNLFNVKPRYATVASNYQGTTYGTVLTINGSGWFLGAFQCVGDDDGMTGYIKIDIDGVNRINDMSLYNTSGYSGVPRNLVVPIRFETQLIVYHKVASINTGVGTTIIYDLD